MRTKILSIIILVLAFPSFMYVIVMGGMCVQYIMFGDSNMWEQFGTGTLNYKFLIGLSAIMFVFIISVAMYCMEMLKHAGKIDKLEEETKKYREAKEKYEKATKNFTKQFLNSNQ